MNKMIMSTALARRNFVSTTPPFWAPTHWWRVRGHHSPFSIYGKTSFERVVLKTSDGHLLVGGFVGIVFSKCQFNETSC